MQSTRAQSAAFLKHLFAASLATVFMALAPPTAAQAPAQAPEPPQLIEFQFRVNARAADTWPSGPGGALHDASVAVKHDGALSVAWSVLVPGAVPPDCPFLVANCDGEDAGTFKGHDHVDPAAVTFAREFDRNGRPQHIADSPLAQSLACMGARRLPSIAARKLVAGSPGVLAAWDSTWNPVVAPCDTFCGDFCFENMRALEATDWPTVGRPQLADAPPGTCYGVTPSVAFTEQQRLTSWIDTTELCTRVFAVKEGCGPLVVREHEPQHVVGAACAAAALGERFCVLWNEADPSEPGLLVRVRRIDGCTLGAIVDVGLTDRPAAVSMFDDGSFAVVWYDTTNALDPKAKLALYDASEPPALVGPPIVLVTPPQPGGPAQHDIHLTVTVRGTSVASTRARAVVVWEGPPLDELVLGPDVFYRLVDPVTRYVGRARHVALDLGEPKRLGESWQHTAVFRPNGTFACVWTGHREGEPLPDGNVYCTVRLPIF